MSKIIGIDLGTSNSCVAVFEGGKPTVIHNSEGKNTTPSVVAFTADGERKIGDPAKRQAVTNPTNTIYEIKRFMGCSTKDVQNDIKSVTYNVKDVNGYPRVDVNGKEYTPQEISAMILQKMKKTAEDYLGEEVKEAIITVPAYFNDSQRQATKEAGQIAGLEVKRIINEPTAAALAYGLNNLDKEQKILVFDFGGGTHDVSILDLSDGVFEVLATDGDTHLGGKDVDNKIIDWILAGVKEQTDVDVSKDSMAMQRIKEAAEKAKIELSNTTSTEINLPYITAEGGTPKHYTATLGRSLFEQMISDIVKRVMAPVQSALDAAGLEKSDINEVVLVGGSTRIPAIQKAVEDFFGRAANKGVNPDEVVACGASVQGGILSNDDTVAGGKDILLLDVTPLTIGIETLGGVMTKMIPANTTIPTKKTETFSTCENNQSAVSVIVYQGERPMAKDNKCLGMFNLDGIAPAPRGVPQIEISFDVDANGILNVSAKDKATGKEQHITITASSGLSQEEIDRMKAEAEANEEADKKVLEQVNKANAADQLAFTIKKSLDEQAKDFATDEQKADIIAKADAVLAATKDKKYDEIDALQESLEKAWEPVAKKMYESQQQNGADPTNGVFNEAFGGQNPFTNPGAGAQAGSTADATPEAEDVSFEEVK